MIPDIIAGLPDLEIEKGLFGPRLTLDRAWASDVLELMKRECIQELELTRFRRMERDSLDFLVEVPWLKGFRLLDRSLENISGIHYLSELRYLHMSDYSRKSITLIDFLF